MEENAFLFGIKLFSWVIGAIVLILAAKAVNDIVWEAVEGKYLKKSSMGNGGDDGK